MTFGRCPVTPSPNRIRSLTIRLHQRPADTGHAALGHSAGERQRERGESHLLSDGKASLAEAEQLPVYRRQMR